jgi:cytochrome C biogenesis protein
LWFFGILASSFGTLVGKYMPYLNIAFGILVILMGINYLGIIKIDVLNKEYKFDVDSSDTNLTRIKALLFGIFFALTWSPCSGAYLAFAMNSALNTSTILEGRIPTFHICNGNSSTNAFSHNVYNKIKRYI